ncbi:PLASMODESMATA CALLOSE-BINDING PROTEIN 3-like [Melia azedarach]|uniref:PLASMODESMATA CALLOSE-BINDING PROTEIN 3-like n=1 Tax=Melia azedarach TaxID=155640 RepID=A0ACC1YII1_MELAZ|nr:PLASMODESMATA CALLOSE-BINDING PROTEIN 3-like [Melia azedarach]
MSMAALSNLLCLSFIFFFFCMNMVIMAAKTSVQVEATSWCVARSDASNQALQTALDYACGAGADCQPIHSDGLCYLPNTMQAHASYAFDSYFQRKGMAPGSCDFSGTATIAKTDPSYGSCVYPSSLSTAGGTPTQGTSPTTTTTNNPNMPTTPSSTTPLVDNGGSNGMIPGMTPPISTTDNSEASSKLPAISILMHISFGLLLSSIFPYI